MNKDMECPYCGDWIEICHDGGHGCEDGKTYEEECGACGKCFIFTASISFSYFPVKADCLNGAKHNWEPIIGRSKFWPDAKRCKDCRLADHGTPDYNAIGDKLQ